jgi:hypothetical protein
MDEGDVALRKAVNYRIVQAMRMQELRGMTASCGKRKGLRVWQNAHGVGLNRALVDR